MDTPTKTPLISGRDDLLRKGRAPSGPPGLGNEQPVAVPLLGPDGEKIVQETMSAALRRAIETRDEAQKALVRATAAARRAAEENPSRAALISFGAGVFVGVAATAIFFRD